MCLFVLCCMVGCLVVVLFVGVTCWLRCFVGLIAGIGFGVMRNIVDWWFWCGALGFLGLVGYEF